MKQPPATGLSNLNPSQKNQTRVTQKISTTTLTSLSHTRLTSSDQTHNSTRRRWTPRDHHLQIRPLQRGNSRRYVPRKEHFGLARNTANDRREHLPGHINCDVHTRGAGAVIIISRVSANSSIKLTDRCQSHKSRGLCDRIERLVSESSYSKRVHLAQIVKEGCRRSITVYHTRLVDRKGKAHRAGVSEQQIAVGLRSELIGPGQISDRNSVGRGSGCGLLCLGQSGGDIGVQYRRHAQRRLETRRDIRAVIPRIQCEASGSLVTFGPDIERRLIPSFTGLPVFSELALVKGIHCQSVIAKDVSDRQGKLAVRGEIGARGEQDDRVCDSRVSDRIYHVRNLSAEEIVMAEDGALVGLVIPIGSVVICCQYAALAAGRTVQLSG